MIYVIGTGPGEIDGITPKALNALNECEIISGYSRYIDLIREYFPGKIFMSYSMRQEVQRCHDALALSRENKNIALISGGDSGVYGMAGLMLEVASGSGEEIRIIPGITAANSCAAILGAPLMNDYVTISLSDLLTDWEIIEKRIICACEGDFVICIYNPASNHRPDNFIRACEIMIHHGKNKNTPAGYVRNIGRENEFRRVTTLGEIMNEKI
ncbi:MAG: precorrin-3B C(17)-methyltransferase, partial [Synergistaceae bacterium]|nr:precorrin-3B C(17)-methyltransferase [Synergistaceae bacterium]